MSKLASSVFGRYLLKEIRRAGTVEILYGHTVESLKELVALRRRCTAQSGYDNGEPRRAYELSHVWPVIATHSLGLLDAGNLVIAPMEFNRKHGQSFPVTGFQGKSTLRASLRPEWKVKDDMETLEVIKLIRRYLGSEFDDWLSGFVITTSQRDQLIKNLVQAGFPKAQLIGMNTSQLRALSKEEELPYFDLDRPATEPMLVLIEELKRLSLAPELSEPLELLLEDEWGISRPERIFSGSPEKKVDVGKWLIEQALLCLHGQPFTSTWKKRPVLEWFVETTRPALLADQDDSNDDFL
jgi:hypothetical protein